MKIDKAHIGHKVQTDNGMHTNSEKPLEDCSCFSGGSPVVVDHGKHPLQQPSTGC